MLFLKYWNTLDLTQKNNNPRFTEEDTEAQKTFGVPVIKIRFKPVLKSARAPVLLPNMIWSPPNQAASTSLLQKLETEEKDQYETQPETTAWWFLDV